MHTCVTETSLFALRRPRKVTIPASRRRTLHLVYCYYLILFFFSQLPRACPFSPAGAGIGDGGRYHSAWHELVVVHCSKESVVVFSGKSVIAVRARCTDDVRANELLAARGCCVLYVE